MKILRLGFANLAALAGEHEIDFCAAPLQQAGLIAITGRTGAGKSTLLDAMCLALYHRIPRLRHAKGAIADASGDTLQLDDSNHILTRGAISGYAELDFVGLDGKRYRAHWGVRRARKKANGTLKNDYTLVCLDDHKTLANQVTLVRSTILQLVGLSFEQFTRAVLLAQSEVGAFLKTHDNERADLLEHLTQSHIFRHIGQLSYAKTYEMRQQLEAHRAQHHHVDLLSAEDIEALTEQQQQLLHQQHQCQKNLDRFREAQLWYQQETHLQQQRHEQHQALERVLQQQPAMDQKRLLIQHTQQFNQIRSSFESVHQIKVQLQHLKGQQQNLDKALQHMHDEYHHALHDQQRSSQQLEQSKRQLIELQPVLKQAHHHEHQIQQLTEHRHRRQQELDRYQSDIDTLCNEIKVQHELHTHLQHTIARIQQQLASSDCFKALAEEPKSTCEKIDALLAKHQEIVQQGAAIDGFSMETFHRAYQQLTDQLIQHERDQGDLGTIQAQLLNQQQQLQQRHEQHQQLQHLFTQAQDCKDLVQRHQQLTLDYTSHQQSLLEYQQQFTQAQDARHQAAEHLKQVATVLAQQRLLQSKHMDQLRQQLQVDQPCMVCGSTLHPFVDHREQFEDLLDHLYIDQHQLAERELDGANTVYEYCQNQIIRQQTTLHHLQQQMVDLDSQQQVAIQHVQQRYEEILGCISLPKPIDSDGETNLIWCANISDHVAILATLDHVIETLSCQIAQMTTILVELQQSQDQLAEHVQYRQSLHRQHQQHQQLAQSIVQFQALAEGFIQQLPSDWQQQWQHDCQRTGYTIKVMLTQRINFQAEQQRQQQIFHQTAQRLDVLTEKHQLLEQQYQQITQNCAQLLQEQSTYQQALKNLFAEHGAAQHTTAEAWQYALHHHQQQLEEQIADYNRCLEEVQRRQQQHREQQAECRAQCTLLHHRLDEEQAHQQRWHFNHKHFDADLIKTCSEITWHEIEQLEQTIATFDQQYQYVQAQLTLLDQQIIQHQQRAPDLPLDQLALHQQAQQDQLQTLQQQYAALTTQLLQNEQNALRQQHLQNQIDQMQHQLERWKRISDVIGDKEGKKFKTLAQEHHLDILIEYANAQLQPFSKRYRLKRIDHSLGLAVIDLDMDHVVRPVQSLSGGETFLVSLALALAIAQLAATSTPLHTLFIDEGFGTLDQDSLNIVMDALDQLQSQRRKVILISHVVELHERIPVKIKLEHQGNGRSRVSIHG